MRVSDEERREVAENLRNLTIGRFIQYKEQFFDELAEVVVDFEDYHDFNVVLERLADLIDIPTCVMTNVGGDFENSFQCSNCMNEFDMPDYDRYPYKRCSECGAVVQNAD